MKQPRWILIVALSLLSTGASYAITQEDHELIAKILAFNDEVNQQQSQGVCYSESLQSTHAVSEYARKIQINDHSTPETKHKVIATTSNLVSCVETEMATAKKTRIIKALNSISDHIAKVSKNLGLLRSN